MGRKGLTYARAGVSVSRGDQLVELIKPLAKRTLRSEVLESIGGFAALSRLPHRYKSPILVTGTDGVGTKVLLATELKKFDTVGIDLVAMSVNDVLTIGAEPLLFLDYFATGHLRLGQGKALISGIAKGCQMAGCALVGGETAEMPQVYRGDDFDLAGFCIGVVEAKRIIDGRKIRPGDVVLGIPSNGIHSNGYSLVRAILHKRKISLRSRPKGFSRTLGEELLRPTRIYVREILRLIKAIPVHSMSHITGGGIEGNLPRAFPHGIHAEVDRSSWKPPRIFRFLQDEGNISDAEMFRTFNMGIGFMLVVPKSAASKACRMIPGTRIVGRVTPGSGEPSVILQK